MALYDLKKDGWQQLPDAHPDTVTAFVDGGNAAIIKTPAAEIHLVRTAVVVISGKKISAVRQKEGYLLVKPDVKNGRVSYKAQLLDSNLSMPVPATEKGGLLELESPGIAAAALENDSSGIGRAAGMARRILELAAAKAIAKELASHYSGTAKKLVVLDGTLETFNSREKSEMESLLASAAADNITIGAVAKTCSLLTKDGKPLIASADEISGGKKGYALVSTEENRPDKATAAIARLNQAASYLFRVEATAAGHFDELLAALESQSNDVAFPGYPYGLIMADRFARVSDNDAEITKSKIAATANAEMKELLRQEKALDAHAVLDRM